MSSTTFVTWRGLPERSLCMNVLDICQSLPNPRQSHQRPPETTNVRKTRQRLAKGNENPPMSVKIRKDSHGLLPWAATGRRTPPAFAKIRQRSAKARESPAECACVRHGPPGPSQSPPKHARVCQSLRQTAKPPKPAEARQTSAKTQRRQSQREHAKKTSVVRGSHFEKYVMKMADVGGVNLNCADNRGHQKQNFATDMP